MKPGFGMVQDALVTSKRSITKNYHIFLLLNPQWINQIVVLNRVLIFFSIKLELYLFV
jgi:hypothetical protein